MHMFWNRSESKMNNSDVKMLLFLRNSKHYPCLVFQMLCTQVKMYVCDVVSGILWGGNSP
jgi:hypothetical protein